MKKTNSTIFMRHFRPKLCSEPYWELKMLPSLLFGWEGADVAYPTPISIQAVSFSAPLAPRPERLSHLQCTATLITASIAYT